MKSSLRSNIAPAIALLVAASMLGCGKGRERESEDLASERTEKPPAAEALSNGPEVAQEGLATAGENGIVVTSRPDGIIEGEAYVDAAFRDRDCPTVQLRVKHGEVRLNPCRERELAEQVPEMQRLLRNLREFQGASWRALRLVAGTDYVTYPAFARRLAVHAARSSQWDARESARATVGAHRRLVEVANEGNVYPELVELFAAVDLRPILHDVEKCEIVSTRSGAEGAIFLRELRLPPGTYPLGCLMSTFTLERRSEVGSGE